MKKQKFSLSLGVVLMLLNSLVVASPRANASPFQSLGSTTESSGFAGDNFAPGINVTTPEPAPNTPVTVDSSGQIFTPEPVQSSLDNAAAGIVSPQGILPGSSSQSSVIVILLGGSGATAAVNALVSSLASLGASPASLQALATALSGLLSSGPSAQLTPGQLVASTKGLPVGSLIAQKGATPKVDINKLNAAINAYNKIVRESSPETVVKLSKDPDFLKIGQVLKQLRSSLSKT
ncbi:hypothetical protein H6G33_22115 [Calothrix sp. FACHB-1219]|uniref:hypothetical protein n=1 Tax=unclassified Calothrix TaxID=2619626 RepID=UPI001685E79D|nr:MULTISPECIES: hypothetical protein [unclassified Calothrix]MBD2206727.1 hypothetical protein [Calothrix sp. FACHB-168]MBD2219717.1 hypothetical protein [Calothrix sp. FACHB-1219]